MSRIKSCFVSRFKSGSLVQADFGQLEVIGAAFLSQDTMMYEDILAGIDSHSQSASWLNPESYEEILAGVRAENPYFLAMRKSAKAPRFELQYGAGAASIARNNNLTKEQAQGFIDSYYGRYFRLKEWQEENKMAVKASRSLSAGRTEKGYPRGRGTLKSPTGRLYTLLEYDAPEWLTKQQGILTSFSPTQVCNYPVQGFATGDVVPLMLGRTFRALRASEFYKKALPIGTIHDSLIWDVQEEYVKDFSHWAKGFLERTPEFIQETWGFVFDLPLHVDLESGPTWDTMKRIY